MTKFNFDKKAFLKALETDRALHDEVRAAVHFVTDEKQDEIDGLTTLLAVLVRRTPERIAKIDVAEMMTVNQHSLVMEETCNGVDLTFAGGLALAS